ncbi:MAG TPA: hypothetical protein PKL29_09845 [Methanothrix sp.]|nr:hypothetical protein [Methanothrix sp.]
MGKIVATKCLPLMALYRLERFKTSALTCSSEAGFGNPDSIIRLTSVVSFEDCDVPSIVAVKNARIPKKIHDLIIFLLT